LRISNISPTEGSRDLKQYRSQVGYVQQDPFGALPPFMTIQRILEEPLIVNGMRSRPEREERIIRRWKKSS
jgi:peptide/nickel transport system ATP-binding protein